MGILLFSAYFAAKQIVSVSSLLFFPFKKEVSYCLLYSYDPENYKGTVKDLAKQKKKVLGLGFCLFSEKMELICIVHLYHIYSLSSKTFVLWSWLFFKASVIGIMNNYDSDTIVSHETISVPVNVLFPQPHLVK